MNKSTGHKKLIAGSLFLTLGEAALWQYYINTDTIQLSINLNTN